MRPMRPTDTSGRRAPATQAAPAAGGLGDNGLQAGDLRNSCVWASGLGDNALQASGLGDSRKEARRLEVRRLEVLGPTCA